MTITTWLKERLYRGARPLFRRHPDEGLERLLPLAGRYQRYLESDPDHRQTRCGHTREPGARLPRFGSPPAGEGAR